MIYQFVVLIQDVNVVRCLVHSDERCVQLVPLSGRMVVDDLPKRKIIVPAFFQHFSRRDFLHNQGVLRVESVHSDPLVLDQLKLN